MQHTDATVREGNSVITAEAAALPNCLVDQGADPIHILRHNELQEPLVGDVVRLQAEYVVHFVGPGDLVGAEVPFPTADVRNMLGFRESSFALLELFQDTLTLGDVFKKINCPHAPTLVVVQRLHVDADDCADPTRRLGHDGHVSHRATLADARRHWTLIMRQQ